MLPLTRLLPGHQRNPFRKQHSMKSCLLQKNPSALRLLGMSWGVKTTCLEAPGVSLGGSGVSIGGVGSLRVAIGGYNPSYPFISQFIVVISPHLQLDPGAHLLRMMGSNRNLNLLAQVPIPWNYTPLRRPGNPGH